MKKFIPVYIICSLLLWSCTKRSELLYEQSASVYFDFTDDIKQTRIDSFFYSFALFPEKSKDTIYLPVRISGLRTNTDRYFKIRVDASSTAVPGKHFVPLQDQYKMPADSGRAVVPVILLGTDPSLTTTAVTLLLKMESTPSLPSQFPAMDSARITFSNLLVKPVWWVVWQGELGEYSRVKYELFIRTSGTTELPKDQTDWQSTPRVLYFTRRFRAFLQDPLIRIADYTQEGYVITKNTDGTYVFYNTGNPTKQYPLRYNTADGKYYFVDETGELVLP
jgi:hypothetical protein